MKKLLLLLIPLLVLFSCEDNNSEKQDHIGVFTIHKTLISTNNLPPDTISDFCTGLIYDGEFWENPLYFSESICDTLWINDNLTYQRKFIQYSSLNDSVASGTVTSGTWEFWESNNESGIVLDDSLSFTVNNNGSIILRYAYVWTGGFEPMIEFNLVDEYIKLY